MNEMEILRWLKKLEEQTEYLLRLEKLGTHAETHLPGGSDPVFGVWQSYTPTFNNLTVGNGTVAGTYCVIGKYIVGEAYILFGSTTAISGAVNMSLPVAPSSLYWTVPVANVGYRDDSDGGAYYTGLCFIRAGQMVRMMARRQDYAYQRDWDATFPFAFAEGDTVAMEFRYRIA